MQDFGIYNVPTDYVVDLPTTTLPAGKATVEEIVENLPEELRETKLEPETLQEVISSFKPERERVIITYPEEKRAEIAKMLGITEVNKVVYSLEELLGE